jgi:hypothetical protein
MLASAGIDPIVILQSVLDQCSKIRRYIGLDRSLFNLFAQFLRFYFALDTIFVNSLNTCLGLLN